MKKLLFGFLCGIFIFSTKAFAAEDWRIMDFNADIEIQTDGRVHVVEEITADFGTLEKHGIYRDIPITYQDVTSGVTTYTGIEVETIGANGEEVPYELQNNNAYLRIRIGDPDRLVSGVQEYRIEYFATGVLRGFGEYDELYWNVTGNFWPIPLEKSTAVVRLPSEGFLQFSCYYGPPGAVSGCDSEDEDGRTIRFETPGPLSPGEGFTVAVGYEAGMVPLLMGNPPKTFSDLLRSRVTWTVFGALLLFGSSFFVHLWWRVGRDRRWRRKSLHDPERSEANMPLFANDPIVVEYDPPQKLRPAELGVLLDETADTLDVSATIVDLAVRGYLTITEEPKKWFLGKTDYTLRRTDKKLERILNYEKILLDGLFSNRTEVRLSKLKNSFYKDLKKVKDAIYEEVTGKGIFTENPQRVRRRYLLWGSLVLLSGNISFFAGIGKLQEILLGMGAAFILLGIMLLVLARVALSRRSAEGRELYRKAKGYELFVSNTEKYRQPFFERENTFMTVLPYAIVFGVTEKLAAAMKEMGVPPPQPTWYTGTHAFNGATFTADLGNFSSSLNTVMASTPGGSGSGGGGSSGGGFGGGGGGSW